MSHYLVGVVVNDISEVDDILAPYDEELEVEPYIYKTKAELIADGRENKKEYSNRDSKDIKDWMKPYIEATTDEDLYKLEIEEYEEDEIDKDGNVLSTYNPKSKWDWYQIGGRFSDGKPTKISDFKLYDDLDDDTIALYKRVWDSFEDKCELTEDEEKKVFGEFRMWNDNYYLDRYGTCENYIKAISSNIPYAFVDANGWYEKGEMGWWGFDNATLESIADYTEFAEKYFTAEENQNKYIVWVDCHI